MNGVYPKLRRVSLHLLCCYYYWVHARSRTVRRGERSEVAVSRAVNNTPPRIDRPETLWYYSSGTTTSSRSRQKTDLDKTTRGLDCPSVFFIRSILLTKHVSFKWRWVTARWRIYKWTSNTANRSIKITLNVRISGPHLRLLICLAWDMVTRARCLLVDSACCFIKNNAESILMNTPVT